MPNFCGSCGAANEGGAFCPSCGRALDTIAPHDHPPVPPAVDPTLVDVEAAQPHQPPPPTSPPMDPPMSPPPMSPPMSPPPQQFAQPGGQPGAAYPSAPQASPPSAAPQPAWGQPIARTNPFDGWPVGDYVRDAAAAFALFATLGMPWELSAEPKAGNQWWVIIAILLAVGSLAVPYLAKAGAVPGWGPRHYRLTKLGLLAPLLLSVAAAVLFELIHVGDDFEGGLGSGLAMALTGAALAVQPRAAEESADHTDDRLWNTVAGAVLAAALGLTALLFVGWFLHGVADTDADIFDPFTQFLAITVTYLVVPFAVVGYPAYQLLVGAKDAAWRRVVATVGFTVPVIALFALGSDRRGLFSWPDVEKWNGVFAGAIPGAGGLLVGAAAALVVSRAQQRATPAVDVVGSWRSTTAAALQVSAVGSALTALGILLLMIDDNVGAGPIVTIILLLGAAGAAGYALTLLGDVRRHRVVLLGLLGGIALVGCVALGINNSEDFTVFNNGWTVAAWLTLPGLAAYGLVVPAQVRLAYGPLVAGGTPPPLPQNHPQPPPPGYPQQGYPQGQPQGYPQQPPPAGSPMPPPGGWNPPPQG